MNDIVEKSDKPYPTGFNRPGVRLGWQQPLFNGVTRMDAAEAWRDCFARWPDELAKRGVIVTKFDEQIMFTNFLLSEGLLLIERSTPDTIGARQVILSFESISALKIVDVVKLRALARLGFESQKGAT